MHNSRKPKYFVIGVVVVGMGVYLYLTIDQILTGFTRLLK